jgi:hypothetical protein
MGTVKTPNLQDLVVTDDDNFFGLEPELASLDRARFVVMSAPFEGTVSYGIGTGAGPEAIRRASQQVELFDEITRDEHIPRHGVCTLKPFDPDCTAEEMTMGHIYPLPTTRKSQFIGYLVGMFHVKHHGCLDTGWIMFRFCFTVFHRKMHKKTR